MKKLIYTLYLLAGLLAIGAMPSANAQCTDWQNPSPTGGWTDFNTEFGGAPCNDGTGCAFNEIQGFQVFASEAYLMDNIIQGGTYAFSMCNGPDAGSWVPDFTIIAPSGAVDAFGAGDGDGCTITWTASEAGTYLIVINEAGQCGGGPNTGTNNGYPAITCVSGANCATACDAGTLVTTGTVNLCAGDFVTFQNTASTVPTGGAHGLVFTNYQGGTGALDQEFILPNVPDSVAFDFDLNGILSANGFPPFSGTWVIYSAVSEDINDPFTSICSVSIDSLVVNFSDLYTVNVFNEGDGSATANPAFDNLPYTYLWSNGQTTQTATGFNDGDMASVTVTDPYGCSVADTTDIVIGTVCDAGTVSTTGTVNLCAGDLATFENSATIFPTDGGHGLLFTNFQGGTGALGGTFVFTGVVDSNSFDFDLNGLLSGNGFPPFSGTWAVYSVVYSDAADAFTTICDVSADSLVINFSDLFGIDIEDNNDGSATANPIFDNLTFTYEWSNGQTTQTATGFNDGDDASVTITDEFGCTVSGQITISIGGNDDPCLDWQNPSATGGWTDFNGLFGGAPCDDGTGCPVFEITAFEAFAAEAYSVDNFIAGGTYAFSICNGPNAGSWVPEFTIIAPSGAVDAFGPGDGDGCTITWTASESGTYLIVINEAGQCGGGNNTQTNNGYPALTCLGGATCPEIPCASGELLSTDPQVACGPDATITVETDGTEDIPPTGGHGWAFSDQLGGTGGLAGGFTLINAPVSESYNSDLNGVMSSNGLPALEGLWVIRSVAYSNANTPVASICSISSDSLVVNFAPTGPTATATDNGDGSATATATGGVAPFEYAWSNGGVSETIDDLPTGTYTVIVTDANGCSDEATVDVVSSVKGIESLRSLVVSPNPTSGKFVVDVAFNTVEQIQVSVMDVTGREILRMKGMAAAQRFDLNLDNQPDGVYMLRVSASGGTVTRKVVVTK